MVSRQQKVSRVVGVCVSEHRGGEPGMFFNPAIKGPRFNQQQLATGDDPDMGLHVALKVSDADAEGRRGLCAREEATRDGFDRTVA
jgi:hypothetical protein